MANQIWQSAGAVVGGSSVLSREDPSVELFRFFAANLKLPVIQVALDGSWGKSPDGLGAYAGVAAPTQLWEAFGTQWRLTLDKFGLRYFRMVDAVHWQGSFKAKYSEWGVERDSQREALLRQLAMLARKCDFQLVGAASEIHKFPEKKQVDRKRRLFQRLMLDVLHAAPPGWPVCFICDREQDLSANCLQWLENLQQRHPEIRTQVAGLCYMSAEHVLPIQCADLVAYLMREDSERRHYRSVKPSNPVYTILAGREPEARYVTHLQFFDELRDP